MAQENIIKKLNTELSKGIKNEPQVVYILSRIRKLLEIREEKNKYELLNFYCNWALHVELSYRNTTQIISTKFDKYINLSKTVEEIGKNIYSNCFDFFILNDLKEDLINFLKDNGLPFNFFDRKSDAIGFIKLLFEIIEECPVVCIASSGKIETLKFEKDDNGNFCYRFKFKNKRVVSKLKIKFK